MKLIRFSLTIILLFTGMAAAFAQTGISTAKPWTYWWWMGSAVNRTDIRKQLTEFSAAGLGGVHIVPIYGVKGFENQFIPFLSDPWLEMVNYTIREARKLNMGVDMTLGMGWPYGGPWVNEAGAAKKLVPQLDLSNPAGYRWAPTGQKVKRAAPGGEGAVIDYFDGAAVMDYLHHFDSVFLKSKYPIQPRSWYHDSYEAYGANWLVRFPERFRELHGYEVSEALRLMHDSLNPGRPRALHDYRETLADLLYTEFAFNWTAWSRNRGSSTRYQAHGSPGNLLDLYALADIPETESFGCSNFPIPKLHNDPDYEVSRFGRPSPLMMKMASSPAHLLGKLLVSSETATWLANHFKVSLSQVKPQVDELFVSGINHIFYHGITYSPESETYPGWLFYASTNFGPRSHFWNELPLLNSYIRECQSVLQNSTPDNDILVYFPIDELWTTYPGDLLLMLDVHKYSGWFGNSEFGKVSRLLWDSGYAFDYVSDRQIGRLKAGDGGTVSAGATSSYSLIIIPSSAYLPAVTRQRLDSLSMKGVKILYSDKDPANLLKGLHSQRIRQESIKLQGLDFIRKKVDGGTVYFVTNLGNRFYQDSIRLETPSGYIRVFDPNTGKIGYIEPHGRFFMQIPPGQSYFLTALQEKPPVDPWRYNHPVDTLLLDNGWTVNFTPMEGSPDKKSFKTDTLRSWTDWGDTGLKSFCGKGKYVTRFTIRNFTSSGRYRLAIDDIRETAAITINGIPCGTIWCLPYGIDIPAGVLKENNIIGITVQNLSANRIREMDIQRIPWKKFLDINIVDIRYAPFDASNWELTPSGLLGRVMLIRQD